MEWIDALAAVGGTIATGGVGGVLGLIGSGITTFFRNKKEKEEREARIREKQLDYEHELKLYELEEKTARREDEHELDVVNSKGSWSGLEASYRAEAAIPVKSAVVSAILRLVRPALTFTLMGLTAYIFYVLTDPSSGTTWKFALGETTRAELVTYTVKTVVLSASTAVVWWFGDRASSPQSDKHK